MAVLDDKKIEEMIDLCKKTLDKAYCVYSKFPVAAVLVTECGKPFTGKLTCVIYQPLGSNEKTEGYGIGLLRLT